jgi:SAM-dependent methyltransferase
MAIQNIPGRGHGAGPASTVPAARARIAYSAPHVDGGHRDRGGLTADGDGLTATGVATGRTTMELPPWAPDGTDVNVPNAARMYDYALGGYHNFAVDRALVERAEAAVPGARLIAYANRAYLGRVVRWLAAAGIRQFLDIGSGIPTLGNVHEVAQEVATGTRVVYVDSDPVAVTHSSAILFGQPLATVIEADLRQPAAILNHPRVATLLDFTQPVAVLLMAVLHFIPDGDRPDALLGQLRAALAPGSYLAVSHGTPIVDRPDDAEAVRQLYERTPTGLYLRDADRLGALMTGFDLVEPGIVPVTEWHPDPHGGAGMPTQLGILGAVGMLPAVA